MLTLTNSRVTESVPEKQRKGKSIPSKVSHEPSSGRCRHFFSWSLYLVRTLWLLNPPQHLQLCPVAKTMDPIIDKRAELSYLLTIRDESLKMHEKLQSMNASVDALEMRYQRTTIPVHVSPRPALHPYFPIDTAMVLTGWQKIFDLTQKIHQCTRDGNSAVFVKVKLPPQICAAP